MDSPPAHCPSHLNGIHSNLPTPTLAQPVSRTLSRDLHHLISYAETSNREFNSTLSWMDKKKNQTPRQSLQKKIRLQTKHVENLKKLHI